MATQEWFEQDTLEDAMGRVHPEIAHRINTFESQMMGECIYLTLSDLRNAYLDLNDWLQANLSNADAALINEQKLKPSYLMQKRHFERSVEV